jgi:hypothetical protein
MSEVHVLPIAEILREYFLLEHVFDFYEEGLRGLVRDHVLISTSIVCDIHEDDMEDDDADPLVNKIVQAYRMNNLGYRNDYYNNNDERRLASALHRSREIRLMINRLMYVLFRGSVYNIHPQRFQWLGNDLVVHMDLWE